MATTFTSHPEAQRAGVGVGQGLRPISEPQVHEATAPAPTPTPDPRRLRPAFAGRLL